ncbi:immunoglobulin domain protein [Dictyocaulus viviparus]|uniref:Immunoglobulin domain protein n=1 Tax=Dictyocaulus viviparus TaxID=29172 RepID=A0A0D8XY33_DICVI|nr:immunoglobulin domain protein [Dictyocaulus viviparus]
MIFSCPEEISWAVQMPQGIRLKIQISVYPTEAQVRDGREVMFDCRARTADNSVYPPTRPPLSQRTYFQLVRVFVSTNIIEFMSYTYANWLKIQISVYPTEAQVRDGREVMFDCRARTADNSVYPPTRWTRVGGSLSPHAHESSGRLTIKPVSLSDSGEYVCQASHQGKTIEARATLHVQPFQ